LKIGAPINIGNANLINIGNANLINIGNANLIDHRQCQSE